MTKFNLIIANIETVTKFQYSLIKYNSIKQLSGSEDYKIIIYITNI